MSNTEIVKNLLSLFDDLNDITKIRKHLDKFESSIKNELFYQAWINCGKPSGHNDYGRVAFLEHEGLL